MRNDNYFIAVATLLDYVKLSFARIGDPHLPSILVERVGGRERVPFTLVATHPPPPLTGELASARNRQLEALASWLQETEAPHRILVGDLNLTPWSPWFGRLLDSTGMRNAQTGQGRAGTYPAYGLPPFLALPIDHTLVSSNVRVSARLVKPGARFGSDHNAVVTRLWLSRCRQPI